jgi:hypothetical protein
VLAYVFWHAPRPDVAAEEYEHDQERFHRSLAHRRPAGMRGSMLFRVPELPWLAGGGYEDWYLVDDWAALGVLNEAAVGRGHRTAHERAFRGFAAGCAGVLALVEGSRRIEAIAGCRLAIWVARAVGVEPLELEELLGDGIEPGRASLWRRQLVLGPSPELCLLCEEPSAGVGARRLPQGWSARATTRESIWHG